MFSKFIAFIFLVIWVYIISIFFAPEFADQYWNQSLNTAIRSLKDQSLQFATGSESPSSIADKIINVTQWIATDAKQKIASGSELTNTVIDSGKILIDEGKQTLEHSEKVLTEKAEQARKAAESAQKAYEATQQAKQDFQNLTNFSWSIWSVLSGSTN